MASSSSVKRLVGRGVVIWSVVALVISVTGWFLLGRAGMRAARRAVAGPVVEGTPLDPSEAATFNNRGAAAFARGEIEAAVADYTEAIRLAPKYASAYFNRGLAWRAKNNFDKVIADYSEAIHLDPNDATAYYFRAFAWRAKNQIDKAIADSAPGRERRRLSGNSRARGGKGPILGVLGVASAHECFRCLRGRGAFSHLGRTSARGPRRPRGGLEAKPWPARCRRADGRRRESERRWES
jgi:TPR repeat